jgi:hypothetical protein
MKKQTWYIILLLILLILLSLFLGKKIIHEGATGELTTTSGSTNADVSSGSTNAEGSLPGPVFGPDPNSNFPIYKDDLTQTGKILTSVSDTKIELDEKSKDQQNKIKAAEDGIKLAQGQISSKTADRDSLLEKTIKNSYVPEVVYLQLYGDAINMAEDLGITDPSNTMKEMNLDMNKKQTSMSYTKIEGKMCAFFKYDPTNPTDVTNSLNNYISFPFVNPSQFSFSIWVYINPNDSNYYTALSITNKNSLTPSVQLDIQSSNIMIYCALPNVASPLHSKPVSNNGWTYVTYTYDSKANSSMYINKDLVSSFPSNGIFHNENIRYRPNYFFIGRSGDIQRGYNGYLHDFTYYALVLEPKDVVEMYNYTIQK